MDTRLKQDIQLANSSRAINGGAIFSAVSWSECNSKVFFAQLCILFCCFLLAASTQWVLLTVFAQIDKKNGFLGNAIHHFCGPSWLPFDLCHQRESNNDGDSVVPNKKIKY